MSNSMSFRHNAAHLPRQQINDEQRLPAFDLLQIVSFYLKTCHYRPHVIAEIDP